MAVRFARLFWLFLTAACSGDAGDPLAIDDDAGEVVEPAMLHAGIGTFARWINSPLNTVTFDHGTECAPCSEFVAIGHQFERGRFPKVKVVLLPGWQPNRADIEEYGWYSNALTQIVTASPHLRQFSCFVYERVSDPLIAALKTRALSTLQFRRPHRALLQSSREWRGYYASEALRSLSTEESTLSGALKHLVIEELLTQERGNGATFDFSFFQNFTVLEDIELPFDISEAVKDQLWKAPNLKIIRERDRTTTRAVAGSVIKHVETLKPGEKDGFEIHAELRFTPMNRYSAGY